MTSPLIVALDFNREQDALALADQLNPQDCALKVGSELFTFFGPQLVKQLIDRQFKVFLDLKFHDIPNTVANACKAGADLGVWMMNVHASGGMNMMRTAREALAPYGAHRPLLIAVTLLTSFNQSDLIAIGIDTLLPQQVTKLAFLAKESGLDGVVCSAQEVRGIKNTCGTDFITVTPGIRLAGDAQNDQKRIMTPQEAIAEGSDYLVIGRPVTQAVHPARVVDEIKRSI